MKYELPNIFLHFLNKDTQEIFEIPDDEAKIHIDNFQIALNTAILLCDEFCFLPIGFYFKSLNAKKIILDNLEYVREGLLVFAMREKEIAEYIGKTQEQLKDFKKDVNYHRFFSETEIAEISQITGGIIDRKTKIGEYCLLKWKKNLSLYVENYDGDIAKIYSTDKRNLMAAKSISKRLKQIENGNAFIWRMVSDEFKKSPERNIYFEKNLRIYFESNYYKAYLEEYGASILFNTLFDRRQDFLLKKNFASASNFQWFYTFLKCINLEFILNRKADEIVKLKHLQEFILLRKIYLDICNSTSFLHTTGSIRNEVALMCKDNKDNINDLARIVVEKTSKSKEETIISLVENTENYGCNAQARHNPKKNTAGQSVKAKIQDYKISKKEVAHKEMNKFKILFLAASPNDQVKLELGLEAKKIEEEIIKSEFRDRINFVTKWCVSKKELLFAINQQKPDIIHFSGHSDTDCLVFQGADLKAETLPYEILADIIKTSSMFLKVVVLNSCYSEQQANGLSKIIPASIGMSNSISDDAAIIFASQLYSSLGFGCSIENSFEQAKIAMHIENSEYMTPKLFVNKDINAKNYYLITKVE